MTDPSLVNDLRLRVLQGDEISADEMLLIVEQIRAGRRSAAKIERPKKQPKKAARAMTAAEREDLLDSEI